MSEDIDINSDEYKDSPKGLRDAYKALQERLAAQDAQLAEFSKTQRKATLSDLFKAKEVNPKVAQFYPTDADASDEAVTKWLEENGDIFGVVQQSQQQSQQLSEMEAAQARMQAAMQGLMNPGLGDQTQSAVGTPEEIYRLLTDPNMSFEKLVEQGVLNPVQ